MLTALIASIKLIASAVFLTLSLLMGYVLAVKYQLTIPPISGYANLALIIAYNAMLLEDVLVVRAGSSLWLRWVTLHVAWTCVEMDTLMVWIAI